MLSAVVTPPKHNYCRQKRLNQRCSCWPAKRSQSCQSCKKSIRVGDCVRKDYSIGWTHTECPIGNGIERGIPSIEKGFSNVSYSDLARIAAEAGDTPRALCSEFEFEVADDKGDKKRPASKLGANASRNEQYKRAKIGCAAVLYEDDSEDNSSYFEEQRRTREQCDILSCEPGRGEIVAVKAYAGCGKTTTVSLLSVIIDVMSSDL